MSEAVSKRSEGPRVGQTETAGRASDEVSKRSEGPGVGRTASPGLEAWQESRQVFEHDGSNLAYWRAGAGPNTTVLMHGFPTGSYDWHHLWPELAKDGQVMAMDMLGFGFSDKPRDGDYSISAQADRITALLGKVGATRVDLVSHDVGGTVTQELLARAGEGKLPFEIRSVVLLNGGLFPETHRATILQRLLAGRAGHAINWALRSLPAYPQLFKNSFGKILGEAHRHDQRLLDDAWAQVHYQNGERLAPEELGYMEERRQHRERWVGALTNTAVPIRLIDGTADPVSGEHMVKRYEELVAHPDVVRIPGAGHYPQLEAPAEVLKAIRSLPGRR